MNLEEIKKIVERIIEFELLEQWSKDLVRGKYYRYTNDNNRTIKYLIAERQDNYIIKKQNAYSDEIIYWFTIPDNAQDFETVLRILENKK